MPVPRLLSGACLVLLFSCGCGESPGSGGSSAAMTAGTIAGRVTDSAGAPIAVAEEITIQVYGVSTAGEKVQYSPAVKPDGSYRQTVAPGSYRVSSATVKVKFGGEMFTFPLTAKGPDANKSRDAKDGIQQDFVWSVTGKATEGAGDPNNHTHWYGMSVGMRFSLYRDDLKKATQPPPAGTQLVFTLNPVSPCVDGRALTPITIERDFDPSRTNHNDDLSDLPPANWEITALAKLPDGSTKPLLMQGKGDYPAYKPTIRADLVPDKLTGGMFKLLASWAVE